MPPCFAWLFVQLGCTHIGGSQFFEAETIGETQKKAKRWCQFPSWLGVEIAEKNGVLIWLCLKLMVWLWSPQMALQKMMGSSIKKKGCAHLTKPWSTLTVWTVPCFARPKQTWKHAQLPCDFLGIPTSLSGDVIRSKSLFEKSLTPKQWMLWDREWSNLMVLWHPQNWIVQYIPTHSTMSWHRIWLLFNFTQQ